MKPNNIDNKVLVLLSTYNGHKYLRDLLDSVLQQKGVEVYVLARDDGSTDDTVEILNEYAKRFKSITVIEGSNIGARGSFNRLVNHPITKKYKWLAFCDQDDIWLPDKLNVAVTKLEEEPKQSIPLLYCSNTTLVDSNLKKIGLMYTKPFKFGKNTAIVQNIGTGCTEVFNQEAATMYRLGIGSFPEYHDYWMFLVCMFMGKVIYDFNSHIFYRQHGNNTVGFSANKSITKAFHNLFVHERGNRVHTLKAFLKTYQSFLTKEDFSMISKLANYDRSLFTRLCIFFDPNLHAVTRAVTIGFKIRALLGILY